MVWVRTIAAAAAILSMSGANAQLTTQTATVGGCGGLENQYGPYDYADPVHKAEKLYIVEKYHYTAQVDSLTRGESGALDLDIDYTLRAFPNHAPALWAMARYQLGLSRPWAPGDHIYSVECYFDRALRWRPADATVWMIYGMYLARRGDLPGAVEKYDRALQFQPDSAEVNYNAGLAYFEIKKYDRARELATKAYSMGYPLPGLRNKLARVGHWSASDTAKTEKK